MKQKTKQRKPIRQKQTKAKAKAKTRLACHECGAKEKRHRVGGVLMTNISKLLGFCGDCLMAGRV